MDHKRTSHAALIPIKNFAHAKARLASVLTPHERRSLARELAAGVLHACSHLDRFVVCDNDVVADFAQDLGASVIWTPELGLNGALRIGVDTLSTQGYESILICHADLARPEGIQTLPIHDGVTIVPDHRNDGTNVMRVPAGADFSFHYGARSSQLHRAAAEAAGYQVFVIVDEALSHDVDDEADLTQFRATT